MGIHHSPVPAKYHQLIAWKLLNVSCLALQKLSDNECIKRRSKGSQNQVNMQDQHDVPLEQIAVFDGQHPRDASKSSDSKGDAVVPL